MTFVAVVTGASGGMGNATTKEFQARGYFVIGIDRNIGNSGCDRFFQGDICDEDMRREINSFLSEKFGKVDALITIAGRNYLSPIEDAELAQWRNMFDVNVLGMVTAIKHMKALLDNAESPSIVNMSSISGYIGSIVYAAYCSTKGAIDSLKIGRAHV